MKDEKWTGGTYDGTEDNSYLTDDEREHELRDIAEVYGLDALFISIARWCRDEGTPVEIAYRFTH